MRCLSCSSFFFFNDTATTEIYTLSLHDALPIFVAGRRGRPGTPRRVRVHRRRAPDRAPARRPRRSLLDRKSTRLNFSHLVISYAVFCLKKKKTTPPPPSVDSAALSSHIDRAAAC